MNRASQFNGASGQAKTQRTEDGGRRAEGSGQRTEDRGQKTEDRGQRTEDREQKTEVRIKKQDDWPGETKENTRFHWLKMNRMGG
jgi:hypothetical protein